MRKRERERERERGRERERERGEIEKEREIDRWIKIKPTNQQNNPIARTFFFFNYGLYAIVVYRNR
jgi:hypothetical protein